MPKSFEHLPHIDLSVSCSQIEYLQETNRTLEQKVQGLQQRKQDASTEVADLSAKNQELCQELTHIDHLAKQLEKDKDLVLETADLELQEAKVRKEEDDKWEQEEYCIKTDRGFNLRKICGLFFSSERNPKATPSLGGLGRCNHKVKKGMTFYLFIGLRKACSLHVPVKT